MPNDDTGRESRSLKPTVFPVDAAQDKADRLRLTPSAFPLSKYSLGGLGVATRVTGLELFPEVVLRQPFGSESLTGIDARTVRVFRIEPRARFFRPVWDSGINVAGGFVWSRIRQSGVYAPLGLPRDRLLYDTLRNLARERLYRNPQTPEESQELVERFFGPIRKVGSEVEVLRELLTHLEIETSPDVFRPDENRIGPDGVPLPFPLPGDVTFRELQQWLVALEISVAGLPEEQLFYPPEKPDDAEPPWLILPSRTLPWPLPRPCPDEALPIPWPPCDAGLSEDRLRPDERLVERFDPFAQGKSQEILGWLRSRNWWMHHRDPAHTGAALRSAIRRSNVKTLIQRRKISLDGRIVSMPCVVDGKIYIGTSTQSLDTGGILHKIDLETGGICASFPFSGKGSRHAPHAGVGSSPAVTGSRVYFSALTGKVYCLDARTLACQWKTNLRHSDLAHNQPIEHGTTALANGWSSPLVVNNRVYVGCGDGESNTFGYVYCLDALTGDVIWLFCTNQFRKGVDNRPNVIPPSSCAGSPPPLFTKARQDPKARGASPWSAAAYSEALNRIYIGTGNTEPDDPLPDPNYASGLLSLDATTGELKGFFQPCPLDSYREKLDHDVDVPAGPLVFRRRGTDYVAFGSKNGSFFILDADTMKVKARRQLLPYDTRGLPFKKVDPPDDEKHENKSGVFGTAALAAHLGRLYIGLGGYGSKAMDHETTPFIRAVDWKTLDDAWPLQPTDPPMYFAQPPLYTTKEAGLSSPAVVNDVVFVSTTKPALYAFEAESGNWLWEAPGICETFGSYALGPAIYGNYVVNGITLGTDGILYIYSL